MKLKRIFCVILAFIFCFICCEKSKNMLKHKGRSEEKIKVSVVIPVYNVEKYLLECLVSVLNQTLADIEIICIDDGSTDNSGKMLDEHEQMDNRVRVIHQENAGVSAAKNKGIDETRGEYIKFVDSDDSLDLKACEICYKKAKAENADIVLHNSVDMTFNESQFSLLPPGCIWGGFYRTAFLKNNNIKFNESTMYGEDQAFNLICNPKANKIVCFSENLYKYRTDNSGSICHISKVAKHSRSHAQDVNDVYNDWKNNGYFANDVAKVNFLKWFADMNYWQDNYDVDKMFLSSIGPELLRKETLDLLPKEYKKAINKMIVLTKKNV